MDNSRIAVIGGGLGGVSLLAGLVRAAIDQKRTPLTIKIFEPGFIGPGVAYDTHAPDSFKLNHELGHMGSVNVELNYLDATDFWKWTKRNRSILQPLYPGYDLDNPNEYVPRSMYGRYLQVRYEEIRSYAEDHNIKVLESHVKITDILKVGNLFIVASDEGREYFDSVALTTGNYFNQLDPAMVETGRHFRPGDHRKYVSDAIPDGATMLIAGTALFAYDAALYALDSGKYGKVIMTSRRGMLRKVRGQTEPYTRRYLTIATLEMMAKGADKPFRLKHLLAALQKELEYAHGRRVTWKELYSTQEMLGQFDRDIKEVESGTVLIWRSILASVKDAERHELYQRLHEDDKQLFIKKYASLYNLFLAPMPLVNARKVQKYVAEGKLCIVSGTQSIDYMPERQKFSLKYAQHTDGTPVVFQEKSKALDDVTKTYPDEADVYIDATGIGRVITQVPLYESLIGNGLARPNIHGGVSVDIPSYRILDKEGQPTRGLYGIGHMACGETAVSHNSLHMSSLGIDIAADMVSSLPRVNNLFFRNAENIRGTIKEHKE